MLPLLYLALLAAAWLAGIPAAGLAVVAVAEIVRFIIDCL